MIKRISILLLAMVPVALWAQFAPAQDQPGTTAMHADSSAFVAWATGCTVERGPMRIDRPESGLASYGADSLALGMPGGTYDIVSLGRAETVNGTNLVGVGDVYRLAQALHQIRIHHAVKF